MVDTCKTGNNWFESLKDSAVLIIATHRMVGTMLDDVEWATIELEKALDIKFVANLKTDNPREDYSLQIDILIIVLQEDFDIEVDEEDFKPFEESFEVKQDNGR